MKTRSRHRHASLELVRQIEKVLPPSLRKLPQRGWIVTIREVTGMSAAELARRCKVSRSRICYAESAELRGGITIRLLQEIADAIDCELVYAILPRKDLSALLKTEARKGFDDLLRRGRYREVLKKLPRASKEYKRAVYDLEAEYLFQLAPGLWPDSGRKRTRMR